MWIKVSNDYLVNDIGIDEIKIVTRSNRNAVIGILRRIDGSSCVFDLHVGKNDACQLTFGNINKALAEGKEYLDLCQEPSDEEVQSASPTRSTRMSLDEAASIVSRYSNAPGVDQGGLIERLGLALDAAFKEGQESVPLLAKVENLRTKETGSHDHPACFHEFNNLGGLVCSLCGTSRRTIEAQKKPH